MVATHSDGLLDVFKRAERTGDLKQAWTDGGKPTTYKNAQGKGEGERGVQRRGRAGGKDIEGAVARDAGSLAGATGRTVNGLSDLGARWGASVCGGGVVPPNIRWGCPGHTVFSYGVFIRCFHTGHTVLLLHSVFSLLIRSGTVSV